MGATEKPRGARRVAGALVVGFATLVFAAMAAGVSEGARTPPSPVIGAPVTTPTQPVAGQRFTVVFRVTRSDSGALLRAGRMTCDPSVAGKVIPHSHTFSGGKVRVVLVVPASTAGKLLRVDLAIRLGSRSATRASQFRIKAPAPTLSAGDVTVPEGTTGTATVEVPVTLSARAARPVTVAYATSDETAVAPSDYTATSGTVTFAPGQTARTIRVDVVADTAMEPDESFAITLSDPVNAVIADDTAMVTITNDDRETPVTPGAYKGETQNRNHVFFDVLGDRTIRNFRVNDLPMACTPDDIMFLGGSNFGNAVFGIAVDGSFARALTWNGPEIVNDVEYVHWDATVTGTFAGATSVSGTVVENEELVYQGVRYRCTTGVVRWSAALMS